MNKAVAFVKLDLYTMKPYCKALIILLAISIVMMVVFQSAGTMVFYLMMCLVLTSSYPFTIGEKNNMETLYSTLSLRRRDVVIGRYMFLICTGAVCVLFILLSACLAALSGRVEVSSFEVAAYLCVSSFCFSFLAAIQYPIYFKFGYSKSKWVVILPFVLVVVCTMIISKMVKDGDLTAADFGGTLRVVMENPLPALAALMVLGLVLLVISCAISCRLYERREF